MNFEDVHGEFYKKVQDFVNTPVEKLIRNEKYKTAGTIVFDELIDNFEDFQIMLSYINEDVITFLPRFKLEKLKYKLNSMFDVVNGIQTLKKDPNKADNIQKRPISEFFIYPQDLNSLEKGFFRREKEEIWNIIVQGITLANARKNTEEIFNKFLYNSKQEYRILIEDLERKNENAKKILDDLNSTLTSAKTELSKGGVEVHSEIFAKQAKEHSNNARKWRNYSIWLIISTLFIAGFFFFAFIKWIDAKEIKIIIETGVLAALTISMLTFTISLTIKNYFAEKHNESINRHKANCLGTFNTFVDSADEERKQAVLLQATQTIFSHQSSGFLSNDNNVQNPNPFVEIVRNVTSKDIPVK